MRKIVTLRAFHAPKKEVDMPGTSQVNFRIPKELKDEFYAKAIREMGTATRPLVKFMQCYVDDSFYADDRVVGPLYMAVQSLHAYSNNLNQIARKLNSTGRLDPRFTPEFLQKINENNRQIVVAFKSVVTTKTDVMQKLMDSKEFES